MTEEPAALAFPDPIEWLSDPYTQADYLWIKKRLDPRDMVRDVKFNPPIPNMARFTRQWYVDPSEALSPGTGVSAEEQRRFNAPGFIIQDRSLLDPGFGTAGATSADNAAMMMNRKTNWGFRFHYNPASFSETYNRPPDINYEQFLKSIVQSGLLVAPGNTGATISFSLLLNRSDDMRVLTQQNWRDYYPNGEMDEEARQQILTRGTQLDIEYFFRVLNGDPVNTWHGMSSDYGLMWPIQVIVSLGNSAGARKLRCIPTNMSVTHRMYRRGMVPMITEMSMSLIRMSDYYAKPGKDAVGADDAALVASGTTAEEAADSGQPGSTPGGATPPAASSGGYAVPTTGYYLSSMFGEQREGYVHKGLDMGVGTSNPPCLAARQGTVMVAEGGCVVGDRGCHGGQGNNVWISHGAVPGHPEGLTTVYMHLDRVDVVQGQRVEAGTRIGLVGETGDSYGSHLHFQTNVGEFPGSPVDPQSIFNIPQNG